MISKTRTRHLVIPKVLVQVSNYLVAQTSQPLAPDRRRSCCRFHTALFPDCPRRTHAARMMILSLLLLCLLVASGLQLSPKPIGRRAALCVGSVLPLVAAGKAHALTDYVRKDFKDGKYVGPSVVGAAPTAEGEAQLEELYLEALKKQEKAVKAMGFDMDESDRREVEMLVRTQYCGFQAKLKCKGSPAAK